MRFFATDYFKIAGLPAPRQQILGNLAAGGSLPPQAPKPLRKAAPLVIRSPNITPQFLANSSAGLQNPGILHPSPAKVAEFNALAYFATLG